jgi:hypothetical protein
MMKDVKDSAMLRVLLLLSHQDGGKILTIVEVLFTKPTTQNQIKAEGTKAVVRSQCCACDQSPIALWTVFSIPILQYSNTLQFK